LILQPLVENSIRHGIGHREMGGHVDIVGRRVGDRLDMTIRDDGPGMTTSASHGSGGVGLANTRARLEQLYGTDHRFECRNETAGGFTVFVSVPWRQA
jgi:LytS/YehU family sensor histidine kinase